MNIKHKIKSTLVCSAILASIAIANGQDYSFEKIPLNDTNIAQLTNVVKTTKGGDLNEWQATIEAENVEIKNNGSLYKFDQSTNSVVRWKDLNLISGTGMDSVVQRQSSTTPVVEGSNNSSVSQGSFAIGAANVSGLKGYRYTNTGTVTNSLTFEISPEGWDVNDVVSVVNNLKYSDCATIESISGNTVTFKSNLPFSTIVDESHWDSKVAYVLAKPGVGNIEMGYGAVAEGIGTKALNIGTHAEGRETQAIGEYSHAEGRQTVAYYASHAEGRQNKALNNYTHAEGQGNEVYGQFSHVEGNLNLVYGEASHAEGKYTVVNGNNGSHAEGKHTLADGDNSHAEGLGNRTVTEQTFSGSGTFYTSNSNHSLKVNDIVCIEGVYNKIAKISATTSNTVTLADSLSSIEITNKKLEKLSGVAYGSVSHVEGNQNIAIGYGSHAEGALTTAKGSYSHSEGYNTISIGSYSHAEGQGTEASSDQSHAEGISTKASGTASHAEGNQASASGYGSHAEGAMSKAIGNYSHAEGFGTESNNEAEHACGKYNKSNEDTQFSVGIGSNANNRKNGLEVTTDGTVKILMSGSQVSLQQKLVEATGTINPWDIPGVQAAAQQAKNDLATTNSIEGIKAVMQTFLDTFIQPQSNP